jgi:hypothetical protein
MKNITTAVIGAALLCATSLSFAASHTAAPMADAPAGAPPIGAKAVGDHMPMHRHHGMEMQGMMKEMDTNGDGLISKEEFMKFHEQKFDAMPKNKDGMVDPKMMAMHKKPMDKKPAATEPKK